jgi:hypothetical protein
VLSRAGASKFRDPVDQRLVRSFVNHMPGQIDTQADWGGWPTLPAGTALPDANGDGVPDAWALANGFNILTPLHQTLAPSGYTYLEEYVHSLTPYAYAPASTAQHTIRTGFGNGADAQVNENGGLSAISSGNGTDGSVNIHWDGASGTTNQAMLLRFDLSEIVPGSVDSARLELSAAAHLTGTHQFKVYGLEHDAGGWDWNESDVEFANAPGLVFDGNSRTLGIDPRYTANGAAGTQSNPPLPAADDLLTLGTFTIGSTAAGQTVTFDNLNLAVFLNLAAFFEGDDMDGLATIIIEHTASSSPASFWTHEGNPALAPRLVVDAVLQPAGLEGDFNNDGQVDAADYVVWRKSGGSQAEYDLWRANFGTAATDGGSGQAGQVPEPATATAVLVAVMMLASGRRCLRVFGRFLQE